MAVSDAADAQTSWRWVFLLYGAGMLAAFQYARVAYVLPGLLVHTAMNPLEQALLLSSMGIIGVLAGTFVGALGQSMGLKRMLIGGLLLGAVGALMPLAFSSFAALLAARLVEGVSHMAIAVAVPSLMLMLCAPKDKSSAMALWSCYFTTTFIVAALTLPWMLKVGHWQAIVWLHAALLIAMAAVCLRLRTALVGMPLVPLVSVRHLLRAQGRLLSKPGLLVIPATFFGYTLLFVALVNVLPGLLVRSPDFIPRLALLLPAASLVGTLLCLAALRGGLGSQRVVRLAVLGLLLAGVGLLMLPRHSLVTQGVAVFAFILLGLLPAGILSNLSTAFAADDPDITLVNGGVVQFGSLGTFLGAPILASLQPPLGWFAVGSYLLAGTAVIALCPLLLNRAERGRVKSSL